MNEVVYNNCFGGFSLSSEAVQWLVDNNCQHEREAMLEHLNEEDNWGYHTQIPRHDKTLVQCVKTLGNAASGMCSRLKIAEISTSSYIIEDYDGNETVVTPDHQQNWIQI